MGKFIIKINDLYFEWSTIVDSPTTYGMSLSDLHDYIKVEYGNQGLRELPERLKRVKEQGTSCVTALPLDELLDGNRAGQDGVELTKKKIYNIYASSPDIRKIESHE